nr:DNA helicase [Tanacetum cinerariifolium]
MNIFLRSSRDISISCSTMNFAPNIYDEASMNDKRCFETMDTMLRDFRMHQKFYSKERQWRPEVFAKWLLDVGKGEIGEPDEEENQDGSWITIPPEYGVTADETGMAELIDFIYDEVTLKAPTAGGF